MHFPAVAVSGAEILQSGARVRRNQLPLIEERVVGAKGGRCVHRLPFVVEDAVLVENRSAVAELDSAPPSSEFSPLLAVGLEFPIAEEVVEIGMVSVVGCLHLLARFCGRRGQHQ